MPQMSPLNWLTLMTSFIIIFMIFNMMNYYSFTYNITNKTPKIQEKFKINWKW